MEFDFKDKNVLYIISVNVLSFDLCIKDTLQLNIRLLADWSKNILFQNNEINIPQKVSDGQDQQGILIFCWKQKDCSYFNFGEKWRRENAQRRFQEKVESWKHLQEMHVI